MTKMKNVYCAVQNGYLNKTVYTLSLKGSCVFMYGRMCLSYMNCSKDTEEWSPQQHLSVNLRSCNKCYV